MRLSGSIYDNLRQPGVFDDLERCFTTSDQMRRAILARIRFDDLLANDSPDTSTAKLVFSYSDIFEGRLFTLLKPQELQGINLEIQCPQAIAADPSTALKVILSNWIHEDGHGRPLFLLAASGGSSRTEMAEAIRNRHDLKVESIKDAMKILEEVRMPQEEADKLEEHWFRWQEAVTDGTFNLTPFRQGSASAVPTLEAFMQKNQGKMSDFGIGEQGTREFRTALNLLQKSGGKRDVVFKYLEERSQKSHGSLRDELKAVRGVFFHHMFEAIAIANEAMPEHSARVGECDTEALPEKYLSRLESYEQEPLRVQLPLEIVSALGGLPWSDYKKLKKEIAVDIGLGLEALKNTTKTSASDERGRSKLFGAFEKVAAECGADHTLVGAFGNACRDFVCPGLGIAAGAALRFHLESDPASKMQAAVVGGHLGNLTGTFAGRAIKKVTDRASCCLLTNSLVRTAVSELTASRRE